MKYLLLLFFTLSALGQTKGFGVRAKDGSEVASFGKSHALLIAASDYSNGWGKLDAVPAEMAKVEKALEASGFEVTFVKDPDDDQLQKCFEDFIDEYGYDEENRLLFYFSGHGYSLKDRGYLVPVNAPNPNIDKKNFMRKALPMNQILTWCRSMDAKHALFLFDSCFSGTVFKSKSLAKVPPAIDDKLGKPVRQFISAGSANEEVPAKSVFTPLFIRAIEGKGDMNKDGYVTGSELGMYLSDKIINYDSGQTPQYGKIKDPELDEGDFVFNVKLNAKAVVDSSIKAIPKRVTKSLSSSLELTALIAGDLYLDDKKLAVVVKSSLETFTGIPLGEHVLKIKHAGGEWSQKITVEYGVVTKVVARAPMKVKVLPAALSLKEKINRDIEAYEFASASKSLRSINDAWSVDMDVLAKFSESLNQVQKSARIGPLESLSLKNELAKLARLDRLWNDEKAQWFPATHICLERLRNDLFKKLLTQASNEQAMSTVNIARDFSYLFADDKKEPVLKLIKDSFKAVSQKKIKQLSWASSQSTWSRTGSLPDELTLVFDGVPFEFILIPSEDLAIKNEDKVSSVKVSAFYMLKWELTNRQYRMFTEATGYSEPEQRDAFADDDQPVSSISHLDASHFCRWFNLKVFKRRKTKVALPSEVQYLLAAQGISTRKFAWGEKFVENGAFFSENSQARPFKSLAAEGGDFSFYGVRNLGGNVSEWCRDSWSKSLVTNITPGSTDYVYEDKGDLVVAKGGNFTSKRNELEVNFRQKFSLNSNWNMVGFRLVINHPEEFND